MADFSRQAASAIADYLAQEIGLHPGAHYRIREMCNGPRILAMHIIVNPRYASKIMGMAQQLSMAAGLDKEASIRVDRGRGGALALEIPKPATLWYNIAITSLPRRGGLRATVGLDNEHRPTLLDFANPLTPHLLVAGGTGTGKTNAQRLFIYDIASQNEPSAAGFILIDTRKRGNGWRPFGHLPHLLHPIIIDDAMALKALGWAMGEIDRRATSGQTRPQVFIGIDEVQALLNQGDTFVRPVVDIAAAGREFGIHLLAATQDPTSKHLGTATIKRNMARLVGHVDDATAAHVATGKEGSGAHLLRGPGDMLLVTDEVRRVTAPLLTERDTMRLPHSESVRVLDLEEYEDITHVLDQADNQNKVDPLEPAHVAYALAYPEASQRALYDRFNIGFPKIKRVQAYALDVLAELEKLGFSLCNDATGATVESNQIA